MVNGGKSWSGTSEIFVANILWLRLSRGDNPGVVLRCLLQNHHKMKILRLYIVSEFLVFGSKIYGVSN